MDLGLSGRAFVVGGASRGLGRAVAAALVGEGARVLMMSRGGHALEEAASSLGDAAVPLAVDMSDPGLPSVVREAVESSFGGRLDGVLVNAGGPPPGEVLSLSDEVWRGAYELLIGGPIRLLRELEPLLGPDSAVVFVGSSSMRQPVAGLDTSNVFRPGVAALVKVLAQELAPRVRVLGMAPGRIDTDRVGELDSARASRSGASVEEVRREAEAGIPLARYGQPEEFGRVAAFLLSPAASYLSGSTVQVDGAGITALP